MAVIMDRTELRALVFLAEPSDQAGHAVLLLSKFCNQPKYPFSPQRFQRTVKALEDETKEQRQQIHQIHEERVQAVLNEKKRDTIRAFRDALANSVDKKPRTPQVLKSLEAYIRAEEKDRIHSLNHYCHLLKVDPPHAAEDRLTLLRKLNDIDMRVNATIAMLHDFPELETKVKPTALSFWSEYRRENTPLTRDATAVSLGAKGKDERLVTLYETQLCMPSNGGLKMGDAEHSAGILPADLLQPVIEVGATVEREQILSEQPLHFVDDQVDAQAPSMGRHDKLVHEHDGWANESNGVASHGHRTLAMFAACALVVMIVGVVVVRRRRSYKNAGFIEVDLYTPEERHVSGMQCSGYENPTYRYFDKA